MLARYFLSRSLARIRTSEQNLGKLTHNVQILAPLLQKIPRSVIIGLVTLLPKRSIELRALCSRARGNKIHSNSYMQVSLFTSPFATIEKNSTFSFARKCPKLIYISKIHNIIQSMQVQNSMEKDGWLMVYQTT